MKQWAAIFLAMTAICGAGWYYYSTNTLEARFVAACDDAIKDRLKAPSTYNRIEATFDRAEIKLDDYISAKYDQIFAANTDKLKEIYKRDIADAQAGKARPTATRSTITYDAENSFGTPIRDISECLYIDDNGTGDFYETSIMVDGKTNMQRMIEAAKANP